MLACTCRRGKNSIVPFHPSEWPLPSAPWRSQMPVTSPWKDRREGEPNTHAVSISLLYLGAVWHLETRGWRQRHFCPSLGRGWGASSLMHYSHKQHQPRQILSQGKVTITLASWLNGNEKHTIAEASPSFIILYTGLVVTVMRHVVNLIYVSANMISREYLFHFLWILVPLFTTAIHPLVRPAPIKPCGS